MYFPDWQGGRRKNRNKLTEAARRKQKTSPLERRRLLLESLEQRDLLTGVSLTAITGPDANSAFDVPSGKDLYVPLIGADSGQTVTYTVASNNNQVTATVLPSSDPVLQFNVSGTNSQGQAFSGSMTFSLFSGIAPQTVAGIESLVNSGVYNGASFYRSETSTGFQLIQGGIHAPNLTTQPSNTATLPDEFNVAASFNSSGLLAMANAGPGTASSEFFVMAPNIPLDQDPQTLNFGYTIFGQLLTGQDIYNDIENVPTTASQQGIDYDNTPVTITSASIITTSQAGVLQVSEPSTFTGNATITVTAHGSDGSTAQQSFNVVAAAPDPSAGTGGPMALNSISNQTTTENTAVSFPLSVTEEEQLGSTAPVFTVTGPFTDNAASPATPFTDPSADVTVSVTGSGEQQTLMLTPKAGFVGTISLVAHADISADGLHDALPFTLTVTANAPVVTASGTTSSFKVGASAVVVDAGLTVSSDDTDLTGATVTISSGTLQSGDTLHFTNQNGITGNFSGGVLTLTGSATPAQYQAALRSVTFSTTSTNTTTRAISIVALDNALTSDSAAESVKVIAAPVVTASGTTHTFTVGDAAVVVDAGLTLSSNDTDLTGATVTISSGTLQSGDTLHFTNQNGITANFAGGVLTLTGSATPAQYQTALQSVTFSTTSNSPVTRSLSVVALDGSLTSNSAAESVKVITAPILTASGVTSTFTIGGTAVAVDAGITVGSNDTDLTGATVTISSGTLQTGDTLNFTNQNGIIGNFSAGVLSLSGSATPAQYQTALQSVTFSTSSTDTTTRAISVVALDSPLTSNTVAESVNVAVAKPVVTTSGTPSTFTVGGSAVPINSGVTVSYATDLTGATVTISSGTLQSGDTLNFTNQNGITGNFAGGVLTLAGSATPAQYQTALQSVTFSTTSNSPVTRSLSIVALDNSITSDLVTASVDVIGPPVVTPSGATSTVTVGGTAVTVDAGITVGSNDTDLTGATLTISSGTLQSGDTLHFTNQNGITGNFSGGVLTLTGSATPAQYQTALQSVTFSTTSPNTTTRAISVIALDNALASASATESVKVAVTAPVVTASATTSTFTVGGTAVAVDSGMTVTSDDADLTGATVTISSGTLQTGDTLHFTNQNGITGNFSGGVLTLTGSATPAQYQTALQSVTFSTTSSSPVTRSLTIVALDNALTSNAAPKSVEVIAAPVVTASGTTNTFTVGGTAVAVDSGITVTSNDTNLTGATLTISSGTLQTGDTLNFTTQNGITGSFSGGVLTLSGSATVAQYQTALQSVTFSTTSTNATTRAIAVVALDNALTSTAAAESVKVTAASASLSGTAYDDVNQNGAFDSGEATLDNITITLTGTDSSGNAVNKTAQTSSTGTYTFSSLVSGTYSVAATIPTDLMAGKATAGNDGGTVAGEAISGIALAAGATGTGYNFAAYGLAPKLIGLDLFLASTPTTAELLNQGPAISTVANQTINSGASTPATSFTVSDPLASAASLTLSGTSSNTTLVPNANIVYAGSGADRTIAVTPATGQTGTATITTTVSDTYGNQATSSFTLNVASAPVVTPSGTANTFTIGASPVAVDSAVTVSSSDTDLTGATVTISSGTLQSSDLLNFVNQNGITGNYTAGMLTLSGSATPAQYQAALQSVTFSTTSTSTTTRSLSIVALDNALGSTAAAESVKVAAATPAVTPSALAQSATDAALASEDDWTS